VREVEEEELDDAWDSIEKGIAVAGCIESIDREDEMEKQ